MSPQSERVLLGFSVVIISLLILPKALTVRNKTLRKILLVLLVIPSAVMIAYVAGGL